MATSNPTIELDISTDAKFRAFVAAVTTALSAVGLTKLTITGEINSGTVTRPTSFGWWNNYAEYKGSQIWRFDDTLQATAPVFIKVDYGGKQINSPWWSVYGPALQFTLGNARSTLTITGQATTPKEIFAYPAGNKSCRVSGANNRVAFDFGGEMIFAIERTKDATGADTNEGVAAVGSGWTTLDGSTLYGGESVWQKLMFFSGTNRPVESNWGCMVPTAGNGFDNTNLKLFTVHPFTPKMLSHLTGVLAYFDGNMTANATQAVEIYGANKTYWPTQSYPFCTMNRRGETRIAVRYD